MDTFHMVRPEPSRQHHPPECAGVPGGHSQDQIGIRKFSRTSLVSIMIARHVVPLFPQYRGSSAIDRIPSFFSGHAC